MKLESALLNMSIVWVVSEGQRPLRREMKQGPPLCIVQHSFVDYTFSLIDSVPALNDIAPLNGVSG